MPPLPFRVFQVTLALVFSLGAMRMVLRAEEKTGAVAAVTKESVEQWGVFELTLSGPMDGNPFTEVDLTARFRHEERTVAVAGFYDGEGIYRVRFMPDLAGEWRYETVSNRPELQGKVGSFVAAPPSGNNRGPVRVARTFHFSYADGSPYRQIGTTCYTWAQQSDAQQELTLQTLAKSPFNKVRMCLLPQGRSSRTPRLFPFEGTPPRAWDLTRFNPEYFRNIENCVQRLGAIGIEADVILFHPYDPNRGFNSMDPGDDDRYVRYVVARFAAYRNIWWSLSNEYDFNKAKTEVDWDRLLQLVRKSDPYGRLTSIHNGYRIYNHTQPWITHVSLQQGAAVLDPERAMIYRDVYRKPIVYDEVKYEGTRGRRWGRLKPEELVLRFWNGTIAGTYVGHSETIGSGDPAVPGTWLSVGGVRRGQSVERLTFLKKILEESPVEGIDPIDKWQERRMGGKAGEYYLVYFGEQAPAAWPFSLYKQGLVAGMKFTAEILDTWNMTITPVEGEFELKAKDDYDFVDKNDRSIPLPSRPYLALRLRRLGPLPPGTPDGSEQEP
jgi:hypothetical protein